MLASALVDRLGLELNDPLHRVWSEELLLFFLDEAFREIIRISPGRFAKTVVARLDPCSEWHSCPCDGMEISSVLGQSTAEGRITGRLTWRSEDPGMAWTGRECVRFEEPYRAREYAIGADGKSVRVWPPVPPKAEAYLAIRCDVAPDLSDPDADVPAQSAAAAVQWVLYRAKSMDTEANPFILNAAFDHKETFYLDLGVERGRRRNVAKASKD
jgi:hypothetical protein